MKSYADSVWIKKQLQVPVLVVFIAMPRKDKDKNFNAQHQICSGTIIKYKKKIVILQAIGII